MTGKKSSTGTSPALPAAASGFVTKQQLAARWCTSTRTIDRLIHEGKIVVFQPAGRPLISLEDAAAYERSTRKRAGTPELL